MSTYYRAAKAPLGGKVVSDSPEPFVSIVVPVRNAERTIAKTLEHLLAIDYPKDRMEIIVADGGSVDGTVDLLKRWQREHHCIKMVAVPDCHSPGHARNAALGLARGEFVLFTDGDCAPNPDWVRRILRAFQIDPQIGGVGGEVLTLRAEPDNATESYCEQVRFLSVAGRCGVFDAGYLPEPRERAPHEVNGGDHSPFFATANVAFRRAAIDAAGGGFWAEPTGEDVDFSLRVQQQGYRLYFAKDAVVRHMHRVSLASYMKQWYGYGYGHPLLLAKHAGDELEIVLQMGRPAFLRLPSPLKGIMHLGSFHLMHLLAASTAGLALATVFSPAMAGTLAASAGLLALSAASYFYPCLRLRPIAKFFTWCKIRYLSNWALIRGALDGSRRFGALCLEPSW